jgi:uncharacterized protein YhfF
VVPDEQVQQFWDEFCARSGVDPSALTAVEAFGDSPAMADELVALVLAGTKRATAALVSDFTREGSALPVPGDHWIALDGQGRPACVLRTTQVRVGPLDSVDAAFAHDEGEGDRTVQWWLPAHRRFFVRQAEREGAVFDESVEPVVFERFEVVHRRAPEPPTG